jgi:predicted transcriptional regulator
MILTRFHNRSTYEFHLAVLRSLDEKGPAPVTVLAYRAEMNDSQVQEVIGFLQDRSMILKNPVDGKMKIRERINMEYSLSTKYLVSITKRGKKYLNMLTELENQIDWTLRANEKTKHNRQQHRIGN